MEPYGGIFPFTADNRFQAAPHPSAKRGWHKNDRQPPQSHFIRRFLYYNPHRAKMQERNPWISGQQHLFLRHRRINRQERNPAPCDETSKAALDFLKKKD
ncbi:MAG: hypothetical protein LIO54_05810 [Oscillospiraceae bacterium]|nr:hypothetical protein [Oscillospiraceae bacterium]